MLKIRQVGIVTTEEDAKSKITVQKIIKLSVEGKTKEVCNWRINDVKRYISTQKNK